MIAPQNAFQPQSHEPLPGSSRVYVPGRIHANIRVPLREIQLRPTRTAAGRHEPNHPVRVYDCSGPWGDPTFNGEVETGLPALRRSWILDRGDVAERALSELPAPRSGLRSSLRARPGKIVTQFHYARQGLITPEME